MLPAVSPETREIGRSALTTPVALICFKRPEVTERVFRRIAEAKPQTLLLIADGPRTKEEAAACAQVRELVEQVDWDCRVLKNYSDVNLGCRHRPATGIDWIFSQVNEAIILEDDCLPSLSFFYFCQTLLEHYRDDERIFMIGGNNFHGGVKRTEDSYYFSRYPGTWGWATWKRAWQYYDRSLESWPAVKASGRLSWIFENPAEQKYFEPYIQRCHDNTLDAWDYIWLYSYLCQNGLTIEPCVNLVSNIGFGAIASHTFETESPLANVPAGEIWQIKHPHQVIRHKEADAYYFEKILHS